MTNLSVNGVPTAASSSPSNMSDPTPTAGVRDDMTDRIMEKLFRNGLQHHGLNLDHSAKVSVIGVGNVGMAAAYALLLKDYVRELVLHDIQEGKLRAEMLDLQHCSMKTSNVHIRGSTDVNDTAGSKVVVITAGARQREGESRLDLISRNVSIFRGLVPKLARLSPDCVFIVVANPVDVLTYVTWKLSGFPQERVVGSGTALDSARFRFLIADKLRMDTRNVHGYILGEHGDSSVPIWSCVNVGGVNLRALEPTVGTAQGPQEWFEMKDKVRTSAMEIIQLKGYTCWAIGVIVSELVHSIIANQNAVFPITVCAKGVMGIQDEVFLSLPAILGRQGVRDVINIDLTEDERKQLQSSATALFAVQSSIDPTSLIPPSQ